MLSQGFVLLSDQDSDAPATPCVATVSKDDAWDHGALALGQAAAADGRLWCDRPYFTGNPEPSWLVLRLDRCTGVGGLAQVGNEQNLPLEGWVGGRDEWFAFEDTVRRQARHPERLLAMPPSPGMPDWTSWVRDVGADGRPLDHAVHAYGSFAEMRDVVAWYLARTSGRIAVTECNFAAGRTVDRDAWANAELLPFLDWCAGEARIVVVSYFAWRWRSPDAALATPLDAAGTAIETVIRDWRPPPDGGEEVAVLEGVDASNWQGAVDWGAVAGAGRRFAIVKASEDGGYRDPTFATNWAAIKESGLTRGAYHFARPSRVEPAASVALLREQLAAAGGLASGDLVALDFEDTEVAPTAQLERWALDWLAAAEAALGVRPLFYSGTWYTGPHGCDTPALATYPLWLAAYQEARPDPPPSWSSIAIWQYSAHGSVPGVSGDCDLNRFLGDAAALAALGYAGGAAPPASDVAALQDTTWGLADQLQAVAGDWHAAGWPSMGSGVAAAAEAVKTMVRSSKGER